MIEQPKTWHQEIKDKLVEKRDDILGDLEDLFRAARDFDSRLFEAARDAYCRLREHAEREEK